MSRRLVAVLVAAAFAVGACATANSTPDVDPTATTMADQPENPVVVENERPGDGTWRAGVHHSDDMAAMSAYADRTSIVPGDDVNLFVSTTAPQFKVLAYRMGWYGGKRGRQVWRSDQVRGRVQTAQGYVEATRTPYARWDRSLTIRTADWPPGMYLLRVAGSTKAEWLVPLVVRSPDADGRLVVVMADFTWQSYNDWGGRSAYTGPGGFDDRSRAVSYSRPYANGHGTGKYLEYEQPVVSIAEQEGIPVSYVAASDIARDPDTIDGAQGIVSLGHNEYWTVPERNAVSKARDAGTDLAFLGANSMYWRVRLDQSGPQSMPQEVVYKSAAEDPDQGDQTTDRFREGPQGYVERDLVGMDYECYPATGTYTIADPDFFLFRNTGVRKGDTFADLVSTEVDRAYPLPGTPDNLEVVADSPTTCGSAATVSNSTYYSTPSGAGVFAAGTMGWVLKALFGDAPARTTEFARTVTATLLLDMYRGRMGADHPARGNLSSFDLGRTNTTGAA